MNDEMQNLPNTASPIPALWQPVANGHGAVQNQWRHLVRNAPVYAEKGLYRFDMKQGFPPATRSRLRTGEIQLAATGITIQGMETKPVKLLQRIAVVLQSLGILTGICWQVVEAVLHKSPYLKSFAIAFVVVGLVIVVPLSAICIINERRRGSVEMAIAYAAVRCAQVDEKLKWITLVYKAPITELGNRISLEFLTLNNLDPALVASIADTVSYYAPHATGAKVPWIEWTTTRKLVYGTVGGFVLSTILIVSWLIITHRTH